MIDIHSHFLWEVDDGAATLAESLAMLQAARDSGTTDIVATPHLNAQYAFQPDLVGRRIQELAQSPGPLPAIHRGCEFHLNFDNIGRLLENPSLYTIDAHRYLLVECPDLHVGKHADAILLRLLDAGIVPIVAHPERNPVLQQDPGRLAEWVDRGCLVQVTALSITGGFGSRVKSAGARLLDRGLVHVVASDAHDPDRRHPRLDQARDTVRSRYGADAADALFTANPRAIVYGLPLAGGRQPFWQPPAPWWQFWKSRPDLD